MINQPNRREEGFTLIELLIAIMLSGIVTAALASGFIVAIKGTVGAHERFVASNAAQTLASYLTTDVESADPGSVNTGAADSGCATTPADTTNIVRLQWTENTASTLTKAFSASYRTRQVGTDWQLVRYFCAQRTVTNARTTAGSNLLLSDTAGFSTPDVGQSVSGPGIPANTTITSVTSSTQAAMSANASATSASVAVTVRPTVPAAQVVVNEIAPPGQAYSDGVTTSGLNILTSATAAFSPTDVGLKLTGKNIAGGATIASFTSAQQVVISSPATGSGTGLAFTVGRPVRVLTDGVTTNGSTTLTSAGGAFSAGDIGRAVTGTNIPNGAAIASITDGQRAVLSKAATATGSSLPISIGAPYASVNGTTVKLTVASAKALSDSAGYTYTFAADIRTPKIYPAVESIRRADADPTREPSLRWTVTFSRDVTGVDAADFSVTTAGATAAPAVSVTPVSSKIYTVTATSVDGNGALGLSLVDDDSILDASSGRKLGGAGTGNGDFVGDSYTIDTAPPTVVIQRREDPDDLSQNQASPTSALPIYFMATFSEPVTGLQASDLVRTGPTGGTVTVTGSRSYFEIALTGGLLSGSGNVQFTLPAGRVADGAGNMNVASTGGSVTYVRAPVVFSMTRTDANPATGPTVRWTVTFSESVTGVNVPDFQLVPGGNVTGASITSVTGSGTTWTVTANRGQGGGTLGLNLVDDDTITNGTQSLGGPGLGSGDFTGETYQIPGSIKSVEFRNAASGTPGRLGEGDSIVVTFSRSIAVSSFCSDWAGNNSNQLTDGNGKVMVTVTDNAAGGNDELGVATSSGCTFNLGTIGLGSANYVSGDVAFGGNGSNQSTIRWTASTRQLTITLGRPDLPGSLATVASSAPVYTASIAIDELVPTGFPALNGYKVDNSPFNIPAGVQF